MRIVNSTVTLRIITWANIFLALRLAIISFLAFASAKQLTQILPAFEINP